MPAFGAKTLVGSKNASLLIMTQLSRLVVAKNKKNLFFFCYCPSPIPSSLSSYICLMLQNGWISRRFSRPSPAGQDDQTDRLPDGDSSYNILGQQVMEHLNFAPADEGGNDYRRAEVAAATLRGSPRGFPHDEGFRALIKKHPSTPLNQTFAQCDVSSSKHHCCTVAMWEAWRQQQHHNCKQIFPVMIFLQ
jgi:hypothetical protein